jgi:hypothetical protein
VSVDHSIEDISVPCPLCNQGPAVEPMHRICLLRSALGGIGHLLDHQYWCNEVEDTDAGLTRLESARCVEALCQRYGVEAVVGRSFPHTTVDEVLVMAGLAY